ncbi:hypothetical protein ACNKHS_19515 [Shigella flexneri]
MFLAAPMAAIMSTINAHVG